MAIGVSRRMATHLGDVGVLPVGVANLVSPALIAATTEAFAAVRQKKQKRVAPKRHVSADSTAKPG